jgi:plastocyanin
VQAKLLVILAAVGVLLGLGAGGTRADNGQLIGDVGQGDAYVISLRDATGAAVKHLEPGTYTLLLRDHSEIHNFDLKGPGVSVTTDIPAVVNKTFTITLTDGTYSFQCDAHASQMHGSFTVGAAAPTGTKKLSGAIGPGAKLSLKPTAGLSAGKATLTISDATATDGFKLSGPGITRSTGVTFRGRLTWTVTLKPGTYTYSSVTHPTVKHRFHVSS